MYKKFQINQTKIKGSCQSGRKVVAHDSKSDLPLGCTYFHAKTMVPFLNQAICSQVFPCYKIMKWFSSRFFPTGECCSLSANSNTFDIFRQYISIWQKINCIM